MPLFIYYYYYYYLYSFHISILCTYFLRSCYTFLTPVNRRNFSSSNSLI
ncbi:hypothetical protein [Orientia tsutsugamushi]|nr:hypothetical protein [Orientia tsutsugamushi]